MSVLLIKILWYPVQDIGSEAIGDEVYTIRYNITDAIDCGIGKGLEIRNNILTLQLKNCWKQYINSLNLIKFQEQDQIKIWTKYCNDGDENGFGDDIIEPSSAYLLGVYYVIEYKVRHNSKQTQIELRTADKTYILFNKVLARTFTDTEGLTTPQIIQKVIRISSQRLDGKGRYFGTGSDVNKSYDIDTKLISEGGYITDTRRNTKEDEDNSANAVTAFPEKPIGMVWKPIYQWIEELSQLEYLNTDAELVDVLVYGRPFIFWVDDENMFHWVYPSQTSDDDIVVGTDEVYNVNMTKKVFDVTNWVAFNSGDDMYKVGITGYVYDETSDSTTIKQTYIPMTELATKWITDDYSVNVAREGTPDWGNGVTGGKPFPQFPTDVSYPLTPSWGSFTYGGTSYGAVANDSEYNASLVAWCRKEGESRARNILAGVAHARWGGDVELKGQVAHAGDLITFTDEDIGIYQEKLRVMDLKHQITKSGWFTTLTLENDIKAITGSSG